MEIHETISKYATSVPTLCGHFTSNKDLYFQQIKLRTLSNLTLGMCRLTSLAFKYIFNEI